MTDQSADAFGCDLSGAKTQIWRVAPTEAARSFPGYEHHWLNSVSGTVKETGISLARQGPHETCFPKAASLTLIGEMRDTGYPCLGGDEWSEGPDDRLHPTYANWHVERSEDEAAGEYLARSWIVAESFLHRMADDRFAVFVLGDNLS